eukprot:TRINITY_DN5076_c0_g1_i5.p7 TRINITY_DN5076_c0_g1~~TRINITY_DN5076_c0_g1_i5.p7  ORF type:complete len:121 (+),score=8.90 TRINITY_DN5076_c0_g1_i5:682-1044(+)
MDVFRNDANYTHALHLFKVLYFVHEQIQNRFKVWIFYNSNNCGDQQKVTFTQLHWHFYDIVSVGVRFDEPNTLLPFFFFKFVTQILDLMALEIEDILCFWYWVFDSNQVVAHMHIFESQF